MTQDNKSRIQVGERVQVFHGKDRMWRPGRVTRLHQNGAYVRLDIGFEGFFNVASISPAPLARQAANEGEEGLLPPVDESLIRSDGAPAVTVRVVLLTPDLAGELMARNEKNRPINPKHLAKLKEALLGFKFNGDTVRVTRSGRLCDGQKRCQAVVETGISIWTILVEGLDDDVFDTIDIGQRRSAADVLAVLGETNCRALAGALNWVEKYFSGGMERTESVSTYDISDLLNEHRELADSVRHTSGKTKLIPPALMGALHYLFSMDSREEADRFLADIVSGAGLANDDGVYHLRERLMKNRIAKAKLPHFEIAALAIKAWNARRRGAPVRTLRWSNAEGGNQEPFPVLHGSPSHAAAE